MVERGTQHISGEPSSTTRLQLSGSAFYAKARAQSDERVRNGVLCRGDSSSENWMLDVCASKFPLSRGATRTYAAQCSFWPAPLKEAKVLQLERQDRTHPILELDPLTGLPHKAMAIGTEHDRTVRTCNIVAIGAGSGGGGAAHSRGQYACCKAAAIHLEHFDTTCTRKAVAAGHATIISYF